VLSFNSVGSDIENFLLICNFIQHFKATN